MQSNSYAIPSDSEESQKSLDEFTNKISNQSLNELHNEINNYTIHFDASDLPKIDHHYGFISWPYGFTSAYEQHCLEKDTKDKMFDLHTILPSQNTVD